ncbi:hypothetical protein ACFQ3P_44145, partial [Paraburkholderia sabiae]
NGIATRNARLAAIHTFARFLATEGPEHLAAAQAILGIPFKRGDGQRRSNILSRTRSRRC